MKSLLTILIILIVFARCGQSPKEKANMIIEQIYSFEEENSRYPNKLEEINIKSDESGPFYYQLSEDESNFQLYYGLSLGESETYSSSTKSWSENEFDKFIDERESKVVVRKKEDVIPIKENTSRHYMPDNSGIKKFKFSKDMLFNSWAHSDDGGFAFKIDETGFHTGIIDDLYSVPYLIQNDTIEVFEYHGGPNGMETSKGVITKLTNDSLMISFFTGGSSISRYIKFKSKKLK